VVRSREACGLFGDDGERAGFVGEGVIAIRGRWGACNG